MFREARVDRGNRAEEPERKPRSHVCPACGSTAIERASRLGVLEQWILPLVRRRPYRCLACGRRFHDRRL